jgi:hypothetical protein
MATHEQTYLGPIFEAMQAAGYLTIAEDENSYGLAAEFVSRATEAGITINADVACPDCSLDAAWAEAEAASDGKYLIVFSTGVEGDFAYAAAASAKGEAFDYGERLYGPTPAAALRALTAELRETHQGTSTSVMV